MYYVRWSARNNFLVVATLHFDAFKRNVPYVHEYVCHLVVYYVTMPLQRWALSRFRFPAPEIFNFDTFMSSFVISHGVANVVLIWTVQKEMEEAARLGASNPTAGTSAAGTAISVSVIDEVTAFTQANMTRVSNDPLAAGTQRCKNLSPRGGSGGRDVCPTCWTINRHLLADMTTNALLD